jgi:hypothetical protein
MYTEQLKNTWEKGSSSGGRHWELGVGQPAGGTDAHARHLEYLEVGDRGLGEAIAKGFVSGLKGARSDLLKNPDNYMVTL